MTRLAALVALSLALSCGAVRADREEVVLRHVAQLGLAQAAGEQCGMKLREGLMPAIQQAFPDVFQADGTFKPKQVEQLTGAIQAGREVMRALPPAMRCQMAEGWFGASGSIARILERQ